MPKALFIGVHRPDRSPSQRFRFEQYLSFLKDNGWDYDFSYLISAEDDKFFYKSGNAFKKMIVIFRGYLRRMKDAKRVSEYDIVFVQREAFFTGTTKFEKKFSQSKAKLIFDFDDSIWLYNVSEANRSWAWLKNPEKTKQIIAMSDLIFAGNRYLADYAKQVNDNIVIIPTTIDTEEYQRIQQKDGKQICIGWSGSITTIQHFEYALEFLKAIKEKYGDKVCFKVIGDSNYRNEELGVKGLAWNKATEIEELSSFDIGIMPLPNDEWANGKCGLKGLQYMALEIPTIMSPVGVNSEIIANGENGFLAESKAEWVNALSHLIESEDLRNKMGKAARKTVLDRYSVESQKMNYLNEFNKLLNS